MIHLLWVAFTEVTPGGSKTALLTCVMFLGMAGRMSFAGTVNQSSYTWLFLAAGDIALPQVSIVALRPAECEKSHASRVNSILPSSCNVRGLIATPCQPTATWYFVGSG